MDLNQPFHVLENILSGILFEGNWERPNFLIPGAPRSGTTSLYFYLSEHPEVYLNPVKEPQYFTAYFNNSESWYLRQFQAPKKAKAIGEASTNYLLREEAPRRIYEFDDNFKLIFLFRNPVERAYSHYKREIQTQGVNRPFMDLLKESDHYTKAGFYHEHLMRFLNYFDRASIKIVLFEDLIEKPRIVLQGISEFLGVNREFEFSRIGESRNQSRPPTSKWLQQIAYRFFGARDGDNPLFRYIKAGCLLGVNKVNHLFDGEFPEFRSQERSYLKNLYREDVKKLDEFVEQDVEERWGFW